MREDVYRAVAEVPEPPEPEGVSDGEDYVIAFLFLGLGVLFSAIGFSGGREQGIEAGLGVLALLLAVRCFRDARRAASREPKR